MIMMEGGREKVIFPFDCPSVGISTALSLSVVFTFSPPVFLIEQKQPVGRWGSNYIHLLPAAPLCN